MVRGRVASQLAAIYTLHGVVLWAVAGCDSARPTPRPNLLLIVLDTTRADHLGVYGYPRHTSPNLDALARESTVYTDALSTSS